MLIESVPPMTDAFKLVVSTDPPYRALVPEVASRYAELSGGSAADGAALASAVKAALDRVVAGAADEAHIDLSFRPEAGGVHVDLACGAQRETVNVTIPVANR